MNTNVQAPYRLVQLTGTSVSALELNASNQVAFTEFVEPGRVLAKLFDGAKIVDLGTLGGPVSSAVAVNNGGQVAGLSHFDESGHLHAFIWSKSGGMVDLGTVAGATDSYAVDINNRAEVAGNSVYPDEPSARPFVWSQAAGMIDLGPLEGASAVALQINDAGRIMGQASGQEAIFSWTAQGGMVAIKAPDNANILASDMNASGQIVGRYSTFAGPTAFLWSPGEGLMSLAPAADATAINDGAMVAGAFASPPQAFVWNREDGFINLGSLGGPISAAQDLSNRGHVVGHSQTFEGSALHAFLWTPDEGMVNLNTRVSNAPAGLVLSSGYRINNHGAIVAFAEGGGLFLLLSGPGSDEPPVIAPITFTGVQDVGMPLSFSANFTDIDKGQTHTALWAWGDGSEDPGAVVESSGTGSVSGTHTFELAGLYTIALTVTDSGGKRTTVRRSIGLGVPSPITGPLTGSLNERYTSGGIPD